MTHSRRGLVAVVSVLAALVVSSGILITQGGPIGPQPAAAGIPGFDDVDEQRGGSGAPRADSGGAVVTLFHDREEYFVGEPIVIEYRLKNIGTETLPFEFGGDYRGTGRHERFQVTVTDANGNEMPDALTNPMNWGGLVQLGQTLKPGEEHVQPLELHRYRRMVEPGVYSIRIVHDLGWDRTVLVPPIGTTTITLKLPDRDEARQLIERTENVGILRHPVYLPILEELVREGRLDLLPGIAGIHTVEATEALVGMVERGLEEDDFELALAAFGQMGGRLPDPRVFPEGKPGDSLYEYYRPQRELVEQLWRPQFAETLRRLAGRLARERPAEGLGQITQIFEYMGTAEDMPDLILGYTASIKATETLPFETHQYFRPRGSAYSYRFAVFQLLGRGAEVPLEPDTPGAAAAYLIAMQAREDFRPPDWPEQVVRWLHCETPYMRELVLEYMPEPIPEEALAMLPELLADDYVDLQIAACNTAGKHPREAFREPIRKILTSETEQYLLNAATGAGPPNGITTDLVMEIWLDRLDEDELGGKAVVRLLLSVLDDNQARTPKTLDAAAVESTRKRWQRFIDEHREELQQGRRYKLGDPEITPDLFPPGFQFYFDGTPWPPG